MNSVSTWRVRYGVAVLTAVAALLLRLAFTPLVGTGLQYVFAFPAVAVVAWFGGRGPGLAATGMGAMGAILFLETPGGYAQVGAITHVVIFLCGGALISELAESLHRARREAAAAGLAAGRAEAERSRQEGQLRTIVDASPVLISYIDRDFRYRLVNRTYERWFGRIARDMTGRTVREVLGDAAWELVRPYMERALAGEHVTYERELPYTSGTRNVHVIYTPDRDASGQVQGFAVLVTDIGAQKAIEGRLRRHAEQREGLRRLAAALSQALSDRQVARVIVEHGRTVVGAVSGVVRRVVGDALEVVACADDSGEVERAWPRVDLDAMTPLAEAARARRPVLSAAPGASPPASSASAAPEGGEGAAAALPLIVGDQLVGVLEFTWAGARIFDEEALEVLQVLAQQCAQAFERARLHAAAEEARARAEAASRAKDEFLAMLGHELRNPLAPILTAAQLMKLRGDVAAPREREIIERQAQHMVRLIEDLLDVSRIARGKVELRRARLDLRHVLSRAAETVGPLLQQRRHDLAVELPPGPLVVEGDETRLAQVFTNLLTNAASYTPPGGHVTLTARREEGELVVTVRDDGVGIPPTLLPRVFDLFVQGPREADRAQGGLGLGLALVRSLVTLHGGRVQARSEGPGKGSEFIVSLPAVITGPPADVAASPAAPGHAGPSTPRPVRVLVVDDNRDASDMLGSLLASAGHLVQVANDGPSALQVAADFHPEVAVLDLGLPVMDGCELGKRLQTGSHEQPVRLVAVTGYGQAQDQERTRSAGFDAHLVKPVDAHELLDVIAGLAPR